MKIRKTLCRSVLVLLAVAVIAAKPAVAAELTWSYSGHITHTEFPEDFPLGSPVRVAITVDPEFQTLVSATMTFNGIVYEVAGPRSIAYLGLFPVGAHTFYASGPATGETVGDFVPWFGTFFFHAGYPGPFASDPFYEMQSFVFEDLFGRSIGAGGLTLDLPPTPEERLSSLSDGVAAMNLPDGIGASLSAKLSGALATLEDGNATNDVASGNVLRAFIQAVEAQRGKKLTDAQATYLVDSANAVLLALGG
jgi:hypothetical protein